MVHRLGGDAKGATDPAPRHAGLARPADLVQQLFVDQHLHLYHHLERRLRLYVQRHHQAAQIIMSRHVEIIPDHPQKPQEDHKR